MNQPTASVIICTHNPRPDYLRRVADALESQTLPREQWELLLIDNASHKPLAGNLDLSWHPHARILREAEIGLTPARLRGIREVGSDLLVFLDDDNVAKSDYLEEACRVAREHPNLGCYGAGVLKPEFEQAPSPECLPFTGYLAIRTVPRSIWGNALTEMPLPWGAGLVVRRAVAEHYSRVAASCPIRRRLDRKGQSLMSGGDDEFSFAACELGFGVGIFVGLQIIHLIDRRRVTQDYLERILLGNGRSSAMLAHLHQSSLRNPYEVPRLRAVLPNVLGGHPARALAALATWVGFRRRPRIERAFLQARARGWEMGVEDISSCQETPEGC